MTREPLDRESRAVYEVVAEARDQGVPPRSARVAVRVRVTDVNDCSPELVDPQEDVVSVREEQPPGTEVVRVRAVDRDDGNNASVTYSLLTGRDSDGNGVFAVDPVTGVIRTRAVLDHEDRAIYRLAVAATDSGKPPRQTVRLLRVEVLDLNDNRPTFTSSSLVFRVSKEQMRGQTDALADRNALAFYTDGQSCANTNTPSPLRRCKNARECITSHLEVSDEIIAAGLCSVDFFPTPTPLCRAVHVS